MTEQEIRTLMSVADRCQGSDHYSPGGDDVDEFCDLAIPATVAALCRFALDAIIQMQELHWAIGSDDDVLGPCLARHGLDGGGR